MLISRPPKLMYIVLIKFLRVNINKYWAKTRHLHVPLIIIELVLKDFAMHDVLILVDEGTHACVGRRALVFVLDDVEGIGTISVHTSCNYEFVELALAHWVNVSVDVKLDLQSVDLGASLDARD